MVEAIQCPSCQTRYGLRPARVRSGLRRAQCFRCGDVFHIEAEVRRLLGPGAALELDSPASTANVPLAALAEAIQPPQEPTPALEANEIALGDLELPEPEAAMAPAAEPAWPSPAETSPIPSMALAAPEAAPAASDTASDEASPESGLEPELAPGPEEVTGSYSSARDAIAKLFGDAPLAPSPTAKLRSALDMDAGMKALEDTLGGVRPEALSTRPFSAAPEPAPEPAVAPELAGAPGLSDLPELPPLPDLPDLPAASAEAAGSAAIPMGAEDLPHSTATLRMTAAEMMAAMDKAPPALPEPPEITQEEVTMVLPPPSAPSPLAAADPSALRLKIGDQVYTGLDLPTIAKWIEEGRVLEEHQVARGMSENWMEASKVPALRPVFERLRRGRGGADLPPPPPSSIADTGAQKRGLFGGMFGKKD